MESWEQKLTYRYEGAHAKMTLFLRRSSRIPEQVELYAWREEGLIALVGAKNGPYNVHSQGVWDNSDRKVIWSIRLGEYLSGFFPNGQRTYLEVWYDPPAKALIAGEQRREDIRFDKHFQRVDLSSLFRVKLLNTRETGQMKLSCALPLRVSATRNNGLLELTADMDGPIESKPGRYTSYLTGELLAQLCGDWDTASCWGKACVDGWVIGPDIAEVAQVDPLRHFQAVSSVGCTGDRLHILPSLYRSFTLNQKGKRKAM